MSNLDKHTAFGELRTSIQTPVAQVTFGYNNNAMQVASPVTGSGAVTNADSMAVCSTTAATSSSAEVRSLNLLSYRAGQGGLWRGSALFTEGKAGSAQYAGMGRPGADGFFFGYKDDVFGVFHYNDGVEHWIPQSTWNLNRMDGSGVTRDRDRPDRAKRTPVTLDPTKGNVFEIRFQYLGFGAVVYAMEHPGTGEFIDVHRMPYANAKTVPSMSLPHLAACLKAENTTNDTNIVVKGASMYLAVEGEASDDLNVHHGHTIDAFSYTTSGIKAIFTLRSKATYQSKTNLITTLIEGFSAAVDGTKNAVVTLRVNATLGGAPSWSDHETDTSVIEVDTSATTVTGGEIIGATTLAKTGSTAIEILRHVLIHPGDTITVGVESIAATVASSTLTWSERH